MKFTVQSGKSKVSLEANDFNHAAQEFLKILLREDESPSVGEVISVTCDVTESFFLTNLALQELRTEKPLKIFSEQSLVG